MVGLNEKMAKARWADEGDMEAYRRGDLEWQNMRDEKQGLADTVAYRFEKEGAKEIQSSDFYQKPDGTWGYRGPEDPNQPRTGTVSSAWNKTAEGPSDYWMQQGKMDPTSEANQNTARFMQAVQRGNMANSRASQLEGLNYLHKTATGQQSVAGEAMRQAIEQQQAGYAAQALSAQTPAAARAAMYQQAAAQQGAASAGAQAVMQEKMQAQQAYVNALQGARQQDIQGLGAETTAFGAETQARNAQAAENEMIMNMKGKYMTMGMAEEEANRMVAIDYQKFKEGTYQHELDRQAGLEAQARQEDAARSAQAMQFWGSMMQGFATMGASALTKIK